MKTRQFFRKVLKPLYKTVSLPNGLKISLRYSEEYAWKDVGFTLNWTTITLKNGLSVQVSEDPIINRSATHTKLNNGKIHQIR